MKREVRFNQGIIRGEVMEAVLEILPELAPQFEQRKQFFEYYFEAKEVEVSLEQLDRLSKEFRIKLNWSEIEIEAD